MSTLAVNTITAETGNTVSLASGKTLDASQGFTSPAGHVIQVVTSGTISATNNTSTSWASTNYTLNITPTSSSSKIFFSFSNHMRVNGDGTYMRGGIRLRREIDGGSATYVWNGDGSGETMQVRNATNEHDTPAYVGGLDSPSTTGVVTYTIQTKVTTGNYIQNFGSAKGGNIVLMEISG
jgi:hypothetical protein